MPFTNEELLTLTKTLGEQTSAQIKKEMEAYDKKMADFEKAVNEQKGFVTENQYKEWKESADKMIGEVKDAAQKQGTTLAELALKLQGAPETHKSIYDQLTEDEKEIKQLIYSGEQKGNRTYMLDMKGGNPLLIPVKLNDQFKMKTAGPMATVANADGAGGVSSISQSLDSATLLRVGLGAPVFNQYRNTTWVFDLVNLINGTYDASSAFAIWFDEIAYDGGATTVTEGAAKPKTQYKFQLKSQTYKKKATILQITEEFNVDFALLENNIMNVGRVDVLNKVNQDVLADIITNATPYNDGANFKGTVGVQNVNDYDAIAAAASQVDQATFGRVVANTAIMSTTKKYKMGLTKDTVNNYLNPPAVLSNMSFVGNPDMTGDNLLVGDLKQYQLMLRGGMIVRIGYNGTDFAENKFSVVMEQYYMNWISTARKPAIVSGPDFATIKTAIGA